MSQQPPYGSGEPQQPYQPYPPAQGGYPNPYQAYPQRRDNTTRNVLLAVGGVVLLFCGGIVAFFVWGIYSVDSAFDDAFDSQYVGSEDDPLTVAEGEAFEIRGFDYESGWSVQASPDGSLEISGVRGTNNRDDEDTESASLVFELYSDNERLAMVSCLGGSSIAPGRSVTLDCSTFGDDVTGFDEIEVYDTSYLE